MKSMLTTLTQTQRWGLALFLILLSYSLLAPWFASTDANSQDLMNILQQPSPTHWLGTDHFGRDMWVRLAVALQLSMAMALMCVITSASLGTVLGIAAAYGPRWLDRLLEGLMSLILALPGLVLVLIFAAMAPGSFWMLYVAIALTQWVEYFRVSRAMTRQLVSSPAVQSSRLLGFNHLYLFRRHFWPNLAPQLTSLAAFGAANAILIMASLGFVYVGIQPPLAELGLMIVEHFAYYQEAPLLLALPLFALALLVLSFQMIGRRENQQ